MKLNDDQVGSIVEHEERSALDFLQELSGKREKLMNFYNCEEYGNEVDGQSKAVTSDVADVIEWMIPSLVRIFTQGKLVAKFESMDDDGEEEAEHKTHIANHSFMVENDGVLTLHNMFKDALLQYTGVVKVTWEEEEKTKKTTYKAIDEYQLSSLVQNEGVEIVSIDYEETDQGVLYDVEIKLTKTRGFVGYDNIPPDEFLISRTARDFEKPSFIGHRSPKTRSELIQMGFDQDVVNSLPVNEFAENNHNTSRRDLYNDLDYNPSNHKPNDIIYIGEYYIQVDTDGDGITELWKVFYAGNRILEKELVDDHPFAVCVPVPIPHKAIGTCPAEQVADIQYRKSVLVRQMLDNIYQSNYPRVMHSNRVDLDDLLTPRSGGTIGIDTEAADVQGHAVPLVIPNMIEGIMSAIEYTDSEREIRTGITRYSQGLDGEALNKTATGFKGIMDASQQRLDLIARIFADGGIKQIFEKTINTIAENQKEPKNIKVLKKPVTIEPYDWFSDTRCRIDVGLGSGDRQEKIMNLNNILGIQERYMASGMLLADQAKVFNTIEKLIDEIGLKNAEEYFNNPEDDAQVLQAKLEAAERQVQELQAQVNQNPLAEAEMIRAQAKMMEAQTKDSNDMKQFIVEAEQKNEQFKATLAKDLTELELKYNKDVPGSQV